MTITCQVVTEPMRNLLRARNAHVIGLLRAYYVTHVILYVPPPRNSLYYVHVIDVVYSGEAQGVPAWKRKQFMHRPTEGSCVAKWMRMWPTASP